MATIESSNPQLDPVQLRRYLGTSQQTSPESLFDKLIEEGTAYLYYNELKQGQDEAVRETWLYKKLEQSYYHNLTTNIYYLDHFAQTYAKITQEYDTLLLKGVSLLQTVYADPGLRHQGDMDILVKKEDLPKICSLLEKEGYEFGHDMKDMATTESLNSVLCRTKEVGERQPAIHLHWHLINTTTPIHLSEINFDLEAIWRDSTPLPQQPNLRILSPIHQILYYCYHDLKHSFDKKVRLHDLDRTLRFYENDISWQALLDTGKKFGLSRHLYFPLFAAKTNLQSPIPSSVIEALAPQKLNFLENRLLDDLKLGNKPYYGHFGVYLSLQKGFFNKLRFTFRTFFPDLKSWSLGTVGYLIKRSLKGIFKGFKLLFAHETTRH